MSASATRAPSTASTVSDAAPDAAGAAGDDGDLPVQALHQDSSAGRLACIAAMASTSATLNAM